jgi:hypothetical protein
MNKNKASSGIDGKKFLRDALGLEQDVLTKQLELSIHSITHNGVMGAVNEQHFIKVLRRYLPDRYGVDQGIVIDSEGKTSEQIDVIIYDPQYTPPLLDQQNHRYILAEAVYAVLEAKPMINNRYLKAAANKGNSVRCLKRTSVEIPHAGGTYPAKALFPILAGIVAVKSEWADGLQASSFQKALDAFKHDRTLSLGLALEDRAFERKHGLQLEIEHGELCISQPKGSLAWFLFTLLKRLQELGTVPAVDWAAYRTVLSSYLV